MYTDPCRSHFLDPSLVAVRGKQALIANFQRTAAPSVGQRCFTLLELLVVMFITGVLLGLLLPFLAQARRSGRRLACASDMRTLGLGAQTYQGDFNGVLPWEGHAEGDRPVRHLGSWEDPSQWFNAMPEQAGFQPYANLQAQELAGKGALPRDGDQSLFVCPESAPADPGPKDDLVTDGYFMLWGLDAAGKKLDRRKTFWSYGYNTELDAGVEDRHEHHQVYIKSIKRPGETVLLAEKLMRPDEFRPRFLSSVGQSAVSWKEFTTRHGGGGFLLFLDNHVDYFRRHELLAAPGAPSDFNQPGRVIWNPGGPAN